jgi:hypothetical protein
VAVKLIKRTRIEIIGLSVSKTINKIKPTDFAEPVPFGFAFYSKLEI